MFLDATTKSIQFAIEGVATVTAPYATVSYADVVQSTQATSALFSADVIATGNVQVTLVSAPAVGYGRVVKEMAFYNADTVTHTFTVQLLDATAARTQITQVLTTGQVLRYGDVNGWSVGAAAGTGPVGPQGVAGIPGQLIFNTDGEDGLDGQTVIGPQGPLGNIGPQGIQGPSGPVGIIFDGEDGPEGFAIPGSPGPQGPTGNPGPQGPIGIIMDGDQGDDGFPIPGAPGATGPQGITGAPGPPSVGYMPLDGEDGEAGFPIPGPAGTDNFTPVIRGAISTNTGAATFTLAYPAGCQPGDLALLSTGGFWFSQASVPGWSQIDSQGGSGIDGATFQRVLTATDIGSASVTINTNPSGGNVAAMIVFAGPNVTIKGTSVFVKNGGGYSSPVVLYSDGGPTTIDVTVYFSLTASNSVNTVSLGAVQTTQSSGNHSCCIYAGQPLTYGVIPSFAFSAVDGNGYYLGIITVKGRV